MRRRRGAGAITQTRPVGERHDVGPHARPRDGRLRRAARRRRGRLGGGRARRGRARPPLVAAAEQSDAPSTAAGDPARARDSGSAPGRRPPRHALGARATRSVGAGARPPSPAVGGAAGAAAPGDDALRRRRRRVAAQRRRARRGRGRPPTGSGRRVLGQRALDDGLKLGRASGAFARERRRVVVQVRPERRLVGVALVGRRRPRACGTARSRARRRRRARRRARRGSARARRSRACRPSRRRASSPLCELMRFVSPKSVR